MNQSNMETISFIVLKEAILSLFEKDSGGFFYNFVHLLHGLGAITAYNFKSAEQSWLRMQFGSLTSFHDSLKLELDQFFENFEKYFQTNDRRLEIRRYVEYERLIKRKLCRRGPFKRNLINFMLQDIASCYDSEINKVMEKYSAVATRQQVGIDSIKQFICRSFLIN